MKLPYIYLTMGPTICIRFPKPRDWNYLKEIVQKNGKLSEDVFAARTPEQVAVKWVSQFTAKCTVADRDENSFDAIITFEKLSEALEFKNSFEENVFGKH